MRAVTTQVSANQVRWQANVTDSYGGATANGSINPTSTILMKWTSGSTRTWAAGAISIKPAGVGSTYTPIIIKPGVIFKNNVIFKYKYERQSGKFYS
ncbi:MAG: hypothetical protein A3A08_00610 [Candidatus Nealsonbacteria bacterium RIFCSPLOWO2_01_FULL_41_9]|uniref:Uncharacterized protein n=1 Tax=Candidatus Nealsonbacteria bacterium RIFCSPLOWO2_01_FULL_41_9 TaxID=1801671 RepID=A0A1G2EBX1_9BACT|nr:MAG: hypothetical protein A3A08_00610 [Candidatus Nealsonbacteria bacterium RIFCSPLOWO2_01_FULL_41_9]